MTVVCDTRITTKEFVARVPAVYLKSAEGTICAFLAFIGISNLRVFRWDSCSESHPHRQDNGLIINLLHLL
jgi:hypothetical protein